MADAALNLLVPLVVALVTARVTVRLSLDSFRSERWWEKKMEVYSNIVQKLADAKLTMVEWLSETYGEQRLSPSRKDELSTLYVKAYLELRRTAATGAYVISDSSASALETMIREVDASRSPNVVDELETSAESISKALAIVRHEAQKELLGGGRSRVAWLTQRK